VKGGFGEAFLSDGGSLYAVTIYFAIAKCRKLHQLLATIATGVMYHGKKEVYSAEK